MGLDISQYVLYGMKINAGDITEEQLIEYYKKYHRDNNKQIGNICWINSGIDDDYYWLGYIIACTNDDKGNLELNVTLDSETHNQAILGMNSFIAKEKIFDLVDRYVMNFHIFTRYS